VTVEPGGDLLDSFVLERLVDQELRGEGRGMSRESGGKSRPEGPTDIPFVIDRKPAGP
jgi:hypothetical protein